MSIVSIADYRDRKINVQSLHESVKLRPGLIAPAKEEVETEVLTEHDAEPIKSLNDINRITEYLKGNGRYRDNMLFILGINFGLRASDLRELRFCNLINDDMSFKDSFPVFEHKTRNTRKRKKNRYISINSAVIEAVTLYLEHTPDVSLSDYLFVSASNSNEYLSRQSSDGQKPLTVRSIDRMLKGIAQDLGLNIRMSTHTLRKTFCYHQMMMSGNSQRKLLLLQKMLGHSSPAQTLQYIGITFEEMGQAYRELNLGSKECYIAKTEITEFDDEEVM